MISQIGIDKGQSAKLVVHSAKTSAPSLPFNLPPKRKTDRRRAKLKKFNPEFINKGNKDGSTIPDTREVTKLNTKFTIPELAAEKFTTFRQTPRTSPVFVKSLDHLNDIKHLKLQKEANLSNRGFSDLKSIGTE